MNLCVYLGNSIAVVESMSAATGRVDIDVYVVRSDWIAGNPNTRWQRVHYQRTFERSCDNMDVDVPLMWVMEVQDNIYFSTLTRLQWQWITAL